MFWMIEKALCVLGTPGRYEHPGYCSARSMKSMQEITDACTVLMWSCFYLTLSQEVSCLLVMSLPHIKLELKMRFLRKKYININSFSCL